MNQQNGPKMPPPPYDDALPFREFIKRARELCHDLNQPMQAISGYADLLAMSMGREDPNYDKVVKVQGAVQRANDIINDLMTLVRSQTGKEPD